MMNDVVVVMVNLAARCSRVGARDHARGGARTRAVDADARIGRLPACVADEWFESLDAAELECRERLGIEAAMWCDVPDPEHGDQHDRIK
jgi:hypothetical protein